MARRRRRTSLQQLQAFALWIGGAVGVVYETLSKSAQHDPNRAFLLALFAGMCGLPNFVGKDRTPDDDDEPPAMSNGHKP